MLIPLLQWKLLLGSLPSSQSAEETTEKHHLQDCFISAGCIQPANVVRNYCVRTVTYSTAVHHHQPHFPKKGSYRNRRNFWWHFPKADSLHMKLPRSQYTGSKESQNQHPWSQMTWALLLAIAQASRGHSERALSLCLGFCVSVMEQICLYIRMAAFVLRSVLLSGGSTRDT